MSTSELNSQSLWDLVVSGGFTMVPLVFCSLVAWGVIFERLWNYKWLERDLKSFHLLAINTLLCSDFEALGTLCRSHDGLPTARLLQVALERLRSKDLRLKDGWFEALERKRQVINLELRRNLWILGTIGNAAPFIGLFGTVIGILRSFQSIAKVGSGGFAVVAAGISESLIATAAGIVVAVVSVLAFNAFQTRWSSVTTLIRVSAEELCELLSTHVTDSKRSSKEEENGF